MPEWENFAHKSGSKKECRHKTKIDKRVRSHVSHLNLRFQKTALTEVIAQLV